jgi:hypothetical protein
VQELDQLRAAYIEAIEQAVADGETVRAEELAANYEADCVELIADREDKQHLLHLVRPMQDARLRLLVKTLIDGAQATA